MLVKRIAAALFAALAMAAATPASAQFFLKSPDLSGPPVTGAEPGIVGADLPRATPQELRAALVWNLRAALNVAALQCQFAPTLLTLPNYNALLTNHGQELASAHGTLESYFVRVAPNRRAGQTRLDQFGTRIYSGFSTVQAQYTFCQAAGSIGHQALFTPRGQLGDLAARRMSELRNSLVPARDQVYTQFLPAPILMPRMPNAAEERCWRRDRYNTRRCGRL